VAVPPPGAVALLDDVRTALPEPCGHPVFPHVLWQIPDVEVVVAGIETPRGRAHGRIVVRGGLAVQRFGMCRLRGGAWRRYSLYLCRSPRFGRAAMNREPDSYPGAGQHIDQRVDAEEIDLPAYEIADPRLRHPQHLRRRCLRELPARDQAADLNHKVCPEPQAFSLLRREAKILEHVAARAAHPHRHRFPLALPGRTLCRRARATLSRDRARSMCPAGLLLEGVEHIDAVFEFCDVDHSMLESRVNTDLPDAWTDSGHGLPVRWIQTTLDPVEFVTGSLSSILREASHVLSRGSHPQHHLHDRAMYTRSCIPWQARLTRCCCGLV